LIPGTLKSTIEHRLNTQIILEIPILGGDINSASKIHTNSGEEYFLKWNQGTPKGMFEAEAMGLQLLASANSGLIVPRVILSGDDFLLMEYLQENTFGNSYVFGAQLAELHRKSNELFGLDSSNYIGRLPQSNSYHHEWLEFFMRERLEPQVKMAVDAGKMDRKFLRIFNRTMNYTYVIFPKEPPSLLHGDLWGGNFMFTNKGKAAIYDPAVYFGHREMDLAMTRLFGGFSEEFYQGYNDMYPLEKGYEERFKLCNLYPILVHANLFGGNYIQQANQLLKQFF
jgi:fructosamine-3-kinase